MVDFSTAEGKALFDAETRKRQDILGCSREQAQMLTAVLMWEGPQTIPSQAADVVQKDEGCGRCNEQAVTKE